MPLSRLQTFLLSVWHWIGSTPTTKEDCHSEKAQVAFLSEDLRLVSSDRAVYELHFINSRYCSWAKKGKFPEDKAGFDLPLGELCNSSEWPGFVSEPMLQHIRNLLKDPHGRCSFAFRWIQSDWPTRYRMFLSTHRGSLEEAENVLRWIAYSTVENWLDEQASWWIQIHQSDDDPIDRTLWSQTGRDCYLQRKTPEELNNQQHKLLRVSLCYFLPHYRENVRCHHMAVDQLHGIMGFRWIVAVPAPSAHERLEARLRLREWLVDKVAPEEIPALLGEA